MMHHAAVVHVIILIVTKERAWGRVIICANLGCVRPAGASTELPEQQRRNLRTGRARRALQVRLVVVVGDPAMI